MAFHFYFADLLLLSHTWDPDIWMVQFAVRLRYFAIVSVAICVPQRAYYRGCGWCNLHCAVDSYTD